MLMRFAILLALVATQLLGQRVIFDGQELWTVRTARAGLSPQDRATDVIESLEHLANDKRRNLDDAREVTLPSENILLVGRLYLFSVTEEDAKTEGRDRNQLFAERRKIALDAIRQYREKRTWTEIAKSAGLSLATLVGVVLLWVALSAVYRKLSRTARIILTLRKRRGKLASYVRVFAGPLNLVVSFILLGGYILTGIALTLTALSYVLSLFPATAPVAGVVASSAWEILRRVVLNVVEYLPNLLVLIAVSVFTYGLIRIAQTLAHAIATGAITIRGFHREWALPSYDLVRILLILFGLVVAFPYLPGGESPALKGASIFIGVLVSLGSGSAMGNVVAGVILIYMRPFRVGDFVKIGESTGEVIDRSLLVTRIRTTKNVEVIVPNSTVLGAQIVNYSGLVQGNGMILNTTVTIGYEVPAHNIVDALIRAALKVEGLKADPKPFVLQTSLNDSHISYEINAYTDHPHLMPAIYSDLHRKIHEEFDLAGIEIMSPTYLAMRDGNRSTVQVVRELEP
jgi:small-conductance mechanosensitive channel